MSEVTKELIQSIVDNPEANGYRWSSETVQRRESGEKKYPAEIPVPVNVVKFAAAFSEDRVLSWMDGQSVRVKAQGICRNGAAFGKKQAEQRYIIIASMLGVETVTVRVVEKFVAMIEGELVTFDSKEEAEQYLRELTPKELSPAEKLAAEYDAAEAQE